MSAVNSIPHSVIQSTPDYYSKDSSKDKNDLVIFIDKSNQVITVPKGWKRILTDQNKILYITPSHNLICSLDEMSAYLTSPNCCKCGLSCPFFIDELFNFDPQVESIEDCSFDELKVNCKHRHKVNNKQISNNYMESKIIYTTVDNQKGSPSKLVIQNPVLSSANKSNSSLNHQNVQSPINIQQLLNLNHNDQFETADGKIYSYIPIKGDLANLNILNQPIIVTSPINKKETKAPVLQFLNSSGVIQPATMYTVQQPNNNKV